MRISTLRVLLVAALAGWTAAGAPLAPPAAAQTAGPRTIGAATRAQALRQIETQIQASYVYPERRAAIVDSLTVAARAGRYDTPDPIVFATRVSEDLLAATHDSHLYLRYEPEWFNSTRLPPRPGETERQIEAERQIARETNHGLVEMRVLRGNIRYLKIDGFDWVEDETGPAYDAAMRFLKGGQAIIIDLRGNGGGWTQAARYLISHFLGPNMLIATFYGANGELEQYRTVDYLPSGRITGMPIYVLIDGHSRSAAEMVAYTFQQYRLGELIGAQTEGAANVSDDFPIEPAFRLSVSTGRTVQPISNTDWEGVGVAPTVAADPSQALEIAQLRAIDTLLPAAVEGMSRNELRWARPAIEASLHPVTLSEEELGRFAGVYGAASIELQDHALWLHRPDRAPNRLAPMTRDGLFQAVDNETLRVQIGSDSLDVLRIDPAYSVRYRR